MKVTNLVAVGLLFGAIPSGATAGTSYTVDRTDDVVSADACQDNVPDDCSLRGAIRKANQDGIDSVVVLPDGHYGLTLEGPDEDSGLTGDLDVYSDGLSLVAEPGSHPVIEQMTDDRILHFHFASGDMVLQGPMTLKGGAASSGGGFAAGGSIFFFRAGDLTMSDIDLRNGFAPDPGGCLNYAAPTVPSVLSLSNVTFTGCTSEDIGGGFLLQTGDGVVTLDRVRAIGNIAAVLGGGGVVFGGDATVVIERSTFQDNLAAASFTVSNWGGGLFLGDGSFSLLESTVAHNTAGRTGGTQSAGGGVFIQNSLLLVKNSTFSENLSVSTSSRGAELDAQNTTIGIEFSTIEALDSPTMDVITLDSGSTLDVFASVMRANCGGGGAITSDGFNVERVPSGTTATRCNLVHAGDVLTTDPLLGPLGAYGGPTLTHPVLSTAVGTTFVVSSTACPATDQRGAPRLGLFCHSGAFEAGVEAPGSAVFADGFNSGATGAWSATVP